MDQNSHPKWQGKVTTSLTKAKPDQIWLLFLDFFNLHKWFPNLATCYGVHGTNGEPGCIRYCAGSSIKSHGQNESTQQVNWSTERLVAVDHVHRGLTYEIVDNNIGFNSYVSTIKICNGPSDGGCVIKWGFTVDPVEGWVLDNLVKKYEVGLEMMAKRMEDALLQI